MYLTATPSQETYKLSGKKPVAYMSSKQKALEGYGMFPELKTFKAKNISDKRKVAKHNFRWLEGMSNYFAMKLANAFMAAPSDCAITAMEELEYSYLLKQGDNEQDSKDSLRWSLQLPIARKILVSVDDNETLINLNDYIHCRDEYGFPLHMYQNGNKVSRQDIYTFFFLDDHDVKTQAAYQARRKNNFEEVDDIVINIVT